MALLPGTPVIVGAGDVAAAQVGAGASRPGQAHLSLGTASYFGISLDRPLTDPARRLALLGHVVADRRVLWVEMETGAGALGWWRRAAGLGDNDETERIAGSISPTTDGLPLFAPWLTGERVPYWDDDARGAFVGLTYKHGKAELTRAVMEGICFQLRLVFDYARAFGVDFDEIRVVGGAGTGELLPCMLADVVDRTLLLVDDPQSAAARGAAFCAIAHVTGKGVDELSDTVDVTRAVRPSSARGAYEQRFERFRRLHDALSAVSL
jgi:xylulokinase